MRIMMSQNNIVIDLLSRLIFCNARSLPPFLLSCTTNRNISDFDHLHPLESRRDCSKWNSTRVHRDRTSTTRTTHTCIRTNRIYYNIMRTTLVVGILRNNSSSPSICLCASTVFAALIALISALSKYSRREVNLVRAPQYNNFYNICNIMLYTGLVLSIRTSISQCHSFQPV